MQNSYRFGSRRWAAITLVVLAVFATSCGSAARPTLTSDRVEDVAEPSPEPQSASTLSTAPTAAPATLPSPIETADPSVAATPVVVEQLVVEVIESFPHDPTAWTQGLELHDGVFIESTGAHQREGTLRRVVPETGEVLDSVPTPNRYFAEGVTKVGDQFIQLTWQDNTAFYWDAATLELNQQVSYPGEGWGLCFDGERLIMTDGTPVLIFRDPASFDEVGRVPVTFDGEPVEGLNEIECVDGAIWANVWLTDFIVRIDPGTGQITGFVDAMALPRPDDGAAVLNGIAWDSETQTFFVTGKYWPTMYRVNFVPAPTS